VRKRLLPRTAIAEEAIGCCVHKHALLRTQLFVVSMAEERTGRCCAGVFAEDLIVATGKRSRRWDDEQGGWWWWCTRWKSSLESSSLWFQTRSVSTIVHLSVWTRWIYDGACCIVCVAQLRTLLWYDVCPPVCNDTTEGGHGDLSTANTFDGFGLGTRECKWVLCTAHTNRRLSIRHFFEQACGHASSRFPILQLSYIKAAAGLERS